MFVALRHALNHSKDSIPTLKDDLLRDTLLRLPDTEHATSQYLLNNLLYFVDVVHHEEYSADAMNGWYHLSAMKTIH